MSELLVWAEVWRRRHVCVRAVVDGGVSVDGRRALVAWLRALIVDGSIGASAAVSALAALEELRSAIGEEEYRRWLRLSGLGRHVPELEGVACDDSA